MSKFKIEVLFPEIADLYGQSFNPVYMQRSIGDDAEIIYTHLDEIPHFFDEKIDLVYVGSMTETHQVLAMDTLEPLTGRILEAIENGQYIFACGNGFEIFGKEIVDIEAMPYGPISDRVDVENKMTKCLGIFDYSFERKMMHRNNTFFVGKYDKYNDMIVTGMKASFTYAFYGEKGQPLFSVVKGDGFNPSEAFEGLRYKNFVATYLLGPFMVANPDFMISYLDEMGISGVVPQFYDTAKEAFDIRLKEYMDPELTFRF